MSYILKNQYCSVLGVRIYYESNMMKTSSSLWAKRKILTQKQHSKKLRMFGSKLGLSWDTTLNISYKLPRNKKN